MQSLSKELKIIQHDPTVPSRSARISREQWTFYENIIRDWHDMGKTHVETLSVLQKHFDFRPSLAQLNTQMTVWGLKTYKKDDNGSGQEHRPQTRKNLAHEVTGDENTQKLSPPVEFVLRSNKKMRGLVDEYERHVYSDPGRFVHLLWKSNAGDVGVLTFLGLMDESVQRDRETILDCLATLEHVGDFLLAGAAPKDAFDLYSRSLDLRLCRTIPENILTLQTMVRCTQSARTPEQKKLISELSEHCLLYGSITGNLKDSVSSSLRKYYASKDMFQEVSPEPFARDWSGMGPVKLLESILTSLKTTGIVISCPLKDTRQSRDLLLPLQYAIYSHLWRGLLLSSPLEELHLVHHSPNLTQCRLLANVSHAFAQRVVDWCTADIFEPEGTCLWSALKAYFEEANIRYKVHRYLDYSSETSTFFDQSRTSLQFRGENPLQCLKWLKIQILEFFKIRPRLRRSAKLPPIIEHGAETICTSVARHDIAEALDIQMITPRRNEAHYLNTGLEEPTAMVQSLHLRSPSLRSSMQSMLSMASRIKRNARGSNMTVRSQFSRNSMTMSISESFDFGRVTGMGSDASDPQSMDAMMAEEEVAVEQGLFPAHRLRGIQHNQDLVPTREGGWI